MAVPKKRTGSSAQGHRRSNWKATVPETTICKNCGSIVLTHTVCPKCGYYKGKVVSIKAEGYIAEETVVKPAKKSVKTRKSTKKVKVEETTNEPITAETVAEETTTEIEVVKEEEKPEE